MLLMFYRSIKMFEWVFCSWCIAGYLLPSFYSVCLFCKLYVIKLLTRLHLQIQKLNCLATARDVVLKSWGWLAVQFSPGPYFKVSLGKTLASTLHGSGHQCVNVCVDRWMRSFCKTLHAAPPIENGSELIHIWLLCLLPRPDYCPQTPRCSCWSLHHSSTHCTKQSPSS